MKTRLNMKKIARGLGARRLGKAPDPGGCFGALQVLADVETRFRVPPRGGRPTDPNWTKRRLVPLAPKTLKRLQEITNMVRERHGTSLEPMQLAALLLERTAERISETEAQEILRSSEH